MLRYFIRPKTKNSFNLIQASVSLVFLITFVSVFLITLMFVSNVNIFVSNLDMLVSNVNMFVCLYLM